MKKIKSIITAIVFLFGILLSSISYGQVLISIIFGDKLNSDKIEFGLEGGLSLSNLSNIPDSKTKTGLHLGFYFDFLLRKNFYLHTGVIVKSGIGASHISPYPLGVPELDTVLVGSEVTRKLSYFQVPVLAKYKFSNNIFVEGGIMMGLLNNASDLFEQDIIEDSDLEFKNKIKDDIRKFDMGWSVGLGYKLMNGKGMNLGVRYYGGFTNINKTESGDKIKNQVFYFYAGIPIGADPKKSSNETNEQ